MWKNALVSVLTKYLVSKNRGAGCGRKGAVELPAVVKANDSVSSSKNLCGNAALFAAYNKE